MEPNVAIVLAGGDHHLSPITSSLTDVGPQFVVAADSGMQLARLLDLDVDLLVGDLDSISDEDLAAARVAGVSVEAHPADKDHTDLELALRAAVSSGADRVIILGGWGGRFDHLIANTLLLASAQFAAVDLEWRSTMATVHPVGPDRPVRIVGRAGDLVSLIPAGGTARGVESSGLRWNLDGDDLEPGSTRGVSNEMADVEATVAVRSGTLLVIEGGDWS